MSSGRPAYLRDIEDASVPASIPRGRLPHFEFVGRVRREAGHVGLLLRNGIENRRTRQFCQELFNHAVSFENLRGAYHYMKSENGQAPGVDGVTYSDFPDTQWWERLKALSKRLKDGTYRPAELRPAEIQQGSKKRLLRLPTVEDRIVERAIVNVLSPLLDAGFEDFSFGFRPGLSCHDAQARAATITEIEGAYFWLAGDIEGAFDGVPWDALMAALRHGIPSPALVNLLELIIRRPGTAWAEQGKGIHQGGPLSPLLLNVFLNRVLDQRMRLTPPWYQRYADDLLFMGHSLDQVRAAEAIAASALGEHGMKLKEKKRQEKNLRAGESIEYLGLACSQDGGQIRFDISTDTWTAFKTELTGMPRVEDEPDDRKAEAQQRVASTVHGWLNYAAPTLGSNRHGSTDLVTETAALIDNNHLLKNGEYAQDHRAEMSIHFQNAVDAWVAKRKHARDLYATGRYAPRTPNSKSHAAEAAPASCA